MESGSIILSEKRMDITLTRLCHQLIEQNKSFEQTCLIGIQSRGVILAERLRNKLTLLGYSTPYVGKLDITFYRDDFRTRTEPLQANDTSIDFLVEDKKVILIDDVLYSGRTTQAALAAIQDFGRPERVELLVMVDRRFNRELPLQADYVGVTVDALQEAYVKVNWQDIDGEECVRLFSNKKEEA